MNWVADVLRVSRPDENPLPVDAWACSFQTYFPWQAIDVGQQAIAQIVVLDRECFGALGHRTTTRSRQDCECRGTEYGRKRAELEPANEQLAKVGIVRFPPDVKPPMSVVNMEGRKERSSRPAGIWRLKLSQSGESTSHRPSSHTIALRPCEGRA